MTRSPSAFRSMHCVAGIMLPLIPTLCWLALWGSINTGPDDILALWRSINAGPDDIKFSRILSGWIGAFNGIRAAFPLMVLAIWILHLLGRSSTCMREPTPPEWLWF